MESKTTLLFLTQKIDEQDDDLAFVAQWIDQFIAKDFEVKVICLEKGEFDDRFSVYSLGKEEGLGTVRRLIRFFKYIFTLKYDTVFVHMNPEYFTLGGWFWFLSRKPMYLWYTHYTNHIHLKLAAFFCKKMFAATKQSLPQYEHSSKKVVTRHGVDVHYWNKENTCIDPKKMIMVHRLSRSKRVELGIQSLLHLPKEYTLTIYGRPIDADYYQELKDLVKNNNLQDRVEFKGAVPMPELRDIYPNYRIMINMASETIDKTMLEAMCNGIFPVTTSSNLEAIGIPLSLGEDSPESIAKLITSTYLQDFTQLRLVGVVKDKHSLNNLIEKMCHLIKADNQKI
jgi:glycosyltransferase involved in cell wall biosynthesis